MAGDDVGAAIDVIDSCKVNDAAALDVPDVPLLGVMDDSAVAGAHNGNDEKVIRGIRLRNKRR